jgi:hypothetical protein
MARKSFYTKQLGATVANAARPENPGNYHVMSTSQTGKWAVVPKGTVRAIKAFPTQKEAVLFAKQTASKNNGEVVVHDKSGLVKVKISFAKNNRFN